MKTARADAGFNDDFFGAFEPCDQGTAAHPRAMAPAAARFPIEVCRARRALFGRGAERGVACHARSVDDPRLPNGAVGLERNLDLDDEIFGVARSCGDVPATLDLLADEIDLARRQLRPARRLRL